MKTLISAVVAGIVVGVLSQSAGADTIRISVSSGYAPTAAWVHEFQEVFVPTVDAKLAESGAHEIDWNLTWGTITKPGGDFDAVQNGLSDMAIVQTVFHPDKVPMYNISYVTPFVSTDIDAITQVVNGLAVDFPAMTEVWAKYNQHMLTTLAGVDNYQLILRDPITVPQDLAGRKICGAGLNLRYVEGMGVVGVPSPLSEWYNNIRSGICDGTVAWPEAIANFKLYEVAPNLVDIGFGGVNSMALTMNARKWDGLPEEVQSVLTEAAETYRKGLADYAMNRAAESMATFEGAGGKIIPVSPEQRVEWANSVPPIASEWVADLDARGVPGAEILDAYIERMTEAGASPLRDWRE